MVIKLCHEVGFNEEKETATKSDLCLRGNCPAIERTECSLLRFSFEKFSAAKTKAVFGSKNLCFVFMLNRLSFANPKLLRFIFSKSSRIIEMSTHLSCCSEFDAIRLKRDSANAIGHDE